MSEQYGPIEINCDAPPYAIVKAGQRIGLKDPEDVRWCRMSEFLKEQPPAPPHKLQHWKQLLGLGRPAGRTCTCAERLPTMERYTFTFRGGREEHYYIAQCTRCRTIFWDRA
jgi:hypothetical protein